MSETNTVQTPAPAGDDTQVLAAEVLPFHLMTTLLRATSEGPIDQAIDWDAHRADWRKSAETRILWRQAAAQLVKELDEVGLRLEVRNKHRVRQAAKALMTEPERQAFTPGA